MALVDAELVQVVPGSHVAGPSRTRLCGQDDNLGVHQALGSAAAGEVLVVTMPQPAAVALVGDLLALQAKVRGIAGLLIDAAVRDRDELADLGSRSGRGGSERPERPSNSRASWTPPSSSAARASLQATTSS